MGLCNDLLLGLSRLSKSSFRETLQCQHKTEIHLHDQSEYMIAPSLVPRPSDWGEGERRPGIHCVRMRRYYSDFE